MELLMEEMELLMEEMVYLCDVNPADVRLVLPYSSAILLHRGGVTPSTVGALRGEGMEVTVVDWWTGVHYHDLWLRCLPAGGHFALTGPGWWAVVQATGMEPRDVLRIGWAGGRGGRRVWEEPAGLVLVVAVEKRVGRQRWQEGPAERESPPAATVEQVTDELARMCFSSM